MVTLKCPMCRSVQDADKLNSSTSGPGLYGYSVKLFCPFDKVWIDRDSWDCVDWENQKTPVIKEAVEDRFPHRCPRCGAKAYVGFSSVEHSQPEKDATCR